MTLVLTPDPGQVFASDAHRRVLATLPDNAFHPEMSLSEMAEHVREVGQVRGDIVIPTARSFPALAEWFQKHDPWLATVSEPDLLDVLQDLEASGYASFNADNEWEMTARGFEALNGPNGDETPPLEGLRAKAAELQDQALAEEEAAVPDVTPETKEL